MGMLHCPDQRWDIHELDCPLRKRRDSVNHRSLMRTEALHTSFTARFTFFVVLILELHLTACTVKQQWSQFDFVLCKFAIKRHKCRFSLNIVATLQRFFQFAQSPSTLHSSPFP